jgi:kynurenine formamidase
VNIIDLTHPITADLPVYFPWHPATEITQTASYKDNLCVVRRLAIGTHTGTHIDAPSHIFDGMATMDQYDPALWFLDAQVLDFTPRQPRQEITAEEVLARLGGDSDGVIIKTGWDARFGREDYYRTYPPLSNDAANALVRKRIRVLAADTPFTLDVHRILLKEGIPLNTNINNTARLRSGKVKLIAAPLLIKDGDGAPARVLAVA